MIIHSDLEKLIQVFPDTIKEALQNHLCKSKLIEIVLDLGRRPEGRFLYGTEYLSEKIVSWQDLDYTTKRLGTFSNDNRAGIERTLHRISCIRNREGIIIGLTCRIGRCIVGSIGIIRDLLDSNNSLLILGKPGVGKTTLIREISRVLSDEAEKRVVIIDTANEIAGDSDIPHAGIGRARRMQVSKFENQHNVMIEAVENHMPEVIIVDEIGTELEALAARTIAERGVQLVGTAHGNSLESLIKNPTLSDLIGGIQYVTLSDDEARRRGTQKTVLERKSLPAFQIAIELNDKNFWTIHEQVEDSVDSLLQGQQPKLQTRTITNHGHIKIEYTNTFFSINSFFKQSYELKQPRKVLSDSKKILDSKVKNKTFPEKKEFTLKTVIGFLQNGNKEITIYSYYISINKINTVCKSLGINSTFTKNLEEADLIFASKIYFRENFKLQQIAKEKKIKVYILKSNTVSQITNVLKHVIQQNILFKESRKI
jgi:stage III sporulation protein SpoIIIAA